MPANPHDTARVDGDGRYHHGPAPAAAPPPAPGAPLCESRHEGTGGRCIFDAGHTGGHLHVTAFAREIRWWDTPPAPDARGVAAARTLERALERAAYVFDRLAEGQDDIAAGKDYTDAREWAPMRAESMRRHAADCRRALAARAETPDARGVAPEPTTWTDEEIQTALEWSARALDGSQWTLRADWLRQIAGVLRGRAAASEAVLLALRTVLGIRPRAVDGRTVWDVDDQPDAPATTCDSLGGALALAITPPDALAARAAGAGEDDALLSDVEDALEEAIASEDGLDGGKGEALLARVRATLATPPPPRAGAEGDGLRARLAVAEEDEQRIDRLQRAWDLWPVELIERMGLDPHTASIRDAIDRMEDA